MTEKLLKELIALPSVNPATLPPDDKRAGEQRVADYLASLAAAAGMDVDFQPVFPLRSNLILRLAPAGRVRHRIALVPHMDTVGSAQMPGSAFNPSVRNGRLYGCGACDTKGSIAAMMTAIFALAKGGKRPANTEILFVGTVDEEGNQAGSRALAKSRFKADLAIVGEPTSLQVVTAHKGASWIEAKTTGKAAHGSTPHLGVNAIYKMARVVQTIENRYAKSLHKRTHPLLGPPTVNVGVIRGGKQSNIVPDECVIRLDRRTNPGESVQGVIRELLDLFKTGEIEAELRDTKPGMPCPALETSTELPLVKQLFAVARQTGAVGAGYFSDAAILAAAGTPAVLFGPGGIAQAHKPDEYISLKSLERGTRVLEAFLRSLP